MDNTTDTADSDYRKQALESLRKLYSDKAISYFMSPSNMKRAMDFDATAEVRGVCGDTMEIYLTIKDGIIMDASFFTDGCGTTRACGSSMTGLVKGKTIREAFRLSPADVLDDLGGFPWEGMHCAILSVITLYKAIAGYMLDHEDYEKEKRSP